MNHSLIADAVFESYKRNQKKAEALKRIADRIEEVNNPAEEIKDIVSDLRFGAWQIESCGESQIGYYALLRILGILTSLRDTGLEIQ